MPYRLCHLSSQNGVRSTQLDDDLFRLVLLPPLSWHPPKALLRSYWPEACECEWVSAWNTETSAATFDP